MFGGQIVRNPRFLRDAKVLAAVPQPALDALCEALAAAEGFLGPSRLKQLVSVVLTDQEQRRATKNFIVNLQRMRGSGQGPDAVLRQLTEGLQKLKVRPEHSASDDGESLTDDEIDTLVVRLGRLAAPVPALELQAKAAELGARTGMRLQRASLTMDLRPVFDESRDKVLAMFPLTTLKLVAEGADGWPDTFEVYLSEKQLNDLCEAAGMAQRKVSALKRFLEQSAVPIPEAVTTISEQVAEEADGE